MATADQRNMVPDQNTAMTLALEAARIANEALAQIKSHEKVCDVRYQGIEKHMAAQNELGASIKASISRIYDRMWSVTIAAVLLLAGTIIAFGVWVYQKDQSDTQARLDRAEQHYQQPRPK